MAKRIIDWEVKKDGNLVMREFLGGDDLGIEVARFDMKKIFPEYTEMTEVQRFLVMYGTKQKLADAGSQEKTAEAKAEVAKAKFQDFVNGKLSQPRANASGVKEAKAVQAKVNEVMRVVSLESLILKSALNPESFTEEDQKKLDEFMALKVEMEGKKNKKK